MRDNISFRALSAPVSDHAQRQFVVDAMTLFWHEQQWLLETAEGDVALATGDQIVIDGTYFVATVPAAQLVHATTSSVAPSTDSSSPPQMEDLFDEPIVSAPRVGASVDPLQCASPLDFIDELFEASVWPETTGSKAMDDNGEQTASIL